MAKGALGVIGSPAAERHGQVLIQYVESYIGSKYFAMSRESLEDRDGMVLIGGILQSECGRAAAWAVAGALNDMGLAGFRHLQNRGVLKRSLPGWCGSA